MTAYAYHSSRPNSQSPVSTFSSSALPNFSKEFLQQRNSRTLAMRRNSPFLTIANFKKKTESINQIHKEQRIDVKTFCDIFNSNDENQIIQLSDSIFNFYQSSQDEMSNFLWNIKESTESADCYGQLLSNSESNKLTQSLMTSLISCFSIFSSDCKESIVNSGISFKINEIISDFDEKFESHSLSSDDINLLLLSCKLINTVCDNCSYGRDAFLCYCLHENLINTLNSIISENQIDAQTEQIINSLSSAVYDILGNKLYLVDNLDQVLNGDIVVNYVQLASKLFRISHIQKKKKKKKK